MLKKLVCLLSLGVSPLLATANNCQLEAGQSTYSLTLNGSQIGVVTETNQSPKSGQYQMTATTQAKIFFIKDNITETSSGLLNTKQGVVPVSYAVSDSHSGKSAKINFDAAQQQATVMGQNKTKVIAISSNTQDDLSFKLALRWLLISHQNVGNMSVVGQDASKHYALLSFKFTQLGDQKIQTALGVLNTKELSRYDANSQTTDHFWFAKDKDYLLVKTDAVKSNGKVEAETDITAYTPANGCLI